MCLLIIEYGVNHFHLIHPGRIIFGALHREAAARTGFERLFRPKAAGRALIFIMAEDVGMADPVGSFLFHGDT